ncbi:neuropeptide F receptor [Penaeus vannamei]|uniref:Putative neuropeptide Y receptor n=1 Tax=Penaeus vannamei TaxID=6689 RepID=A0A3R7PJV0_PENVA|nr:putative neuropeptide Y receptor [Penaeus vannamei]
MDVISETYGEMPNLDDDDFAEDKPSNFDLLTLTNLDSNLTNLAHNFSWLLNASESLNIDLIKKFQRNRRVDDEAYYSLIVCYSLLIILGATGNSLVVVAVIRKPAMRTARNVFIINLAISDLLLCLITMPLTLVELLSQYWPLGDLPFLCKLVGTLQATCIFVSTISITAIALDRYQVIVYPTKDSLKTVGAVLTLLLIWKVSFILALPNFIWRTLKHHVVNLPDLYSVNFCFEDWPMEHGRGYYSVFVIVVQYCLPIVTVSVSYAMICRKLRFRLENSSVRNSKKTEREDKRMKKTNTLLISIALIFCLSWLPLNLYNLIVDFYNPFGDDMEKLLIVYAVCHMMGMSSACSNPLMYGWLNDNFRKEFLEIFRLICPRCCKEKPKGQRQPTSSAPGKVGAKSQAPLPSPRGGDERPMVLYTKASQGEEANGNCAPKEDVTYITQVVTNATL